MTSSRVLFAVAFAGICSVVPLLAQAPANDNFADAAAIELSSQVTQSNAGATKETGEPNHAGAPGGHSVWWKFTAAKSGFYSINTSGSTIDTVLAVYVGTAVNALSEVAHNDEWATGGGTSTLSFYGYGGTQYAVAVDGVAGSAGTVKVAVGFTAAANLYFTDFESFTVAGSLAGTDGWLTNSNVGGTSGIYQPTGSGNKAAFLGRNATAEPFVTIWRSTMFDAVTAGAPEVRLDVDLLIADSTNGQGDRFAFDFYNSGGQFLCELQFDTRNHGIYSFDGTTTYSTGSSYPPGVPFHFTAKYQLQSNSWSAFLDGRLLILPFSMNTTGAACTLGYIDAIWMITSPGAAGNNYMALDAFRISVAVTPPELTAQPASRTVATGASTVFSVAARPAVGLTYQWRKAGVDLPGATQSTLTFTASQPADAGDYTVVITNPAGTIVSDVARLRIVSPPAPNDAFVNRTRLFGSSATASTHNLAATKETGEPNHAANAGGASVWWLWTAPADGPVTVDTAGSDFDTLLAIYTGTDVSSLSLVGSNDDAAGASDKTSRIVFTAVAGTTYQIVIDGKGGAMGGITFHLSLSTQNYSFSTIAGWGQSGFGDGSGAAVRFGSAAGAATDAAGNIYVVDAGNHVIRKVTPAGVTTTFAGTVGVFGSNDGPANLARFKNPTNVAVDAAGNLFVTDRGNSTIRKITPGGVVSTLAGTAGLIGSADGTAGAARFSSPAGIAVDAASTLYVADTGNQTIRKIIIDGIVTTIAGAPGVIGTADGTGAAARFNGPFGLALGSAGDLFVTDNGSNTIRKIAAAGVVTTLAGQAGSHGYVDGTAGAARFWGPTGIVADEAGNLWVTDGANRVVREITAAGVVSTFAGQVGLNDGADGTGAAAHFQAPLGIARDTDGNLYVTDAGATVRKITPAAVVTTLVGQLGGPGSNDGVGTAARFIYPTALTVDAGGYVYIADITNHTVRVITPAGVVSTLAGQTDTTGKVDGAGAAARFYSPAAIAGDGAGNFYVGDSNLLRKVTIAGVVTTVAGNPGVGGSTDGTGSAATFSEIRGLAINSSGDIYVADVGAHVIRKVTAAGVVTTLAGQALQVGNTDGTGAAARFDHPEGIALDSAGVIYVADTGSHRIRKVTPLGVVTTLAGSVAGTSDGLGAAARFSSPRGVSVDAAGSVFVADFNNSAIRKISAAGAVTTIGGIPGVAGNIDGLGSFARFWAPAGISIDSSGALYIADTDNCQIRKGVLTAFVAPPSIATPPSAQSVLASGAVAFTVIALGSPDPTYQWLKDGSAIPGATGAMLALTNVQVSDAGNYSVMIANSQGSVTTAPVVLTVQTQAPAITSVSAASFPIGKPGSFAVTATGGPAPTFSVISGTFPPWALLDATTGVISGTPNTVTGSPFTFTLQASNGIGTPGTQSFTLTVSPPSGDIYFTDFESFSFGGNQLAGYDGWMTTSVAPGVTGILDGSPPSPQAAYIGFYPTTESSVQAGRLIGYDPVSAGVRLIQFSVDLKVVDSTNGKRDLFQFYLFNALGQGLGGIAFSNSDSHVVRSDGLAAFDAGTFNRGGSYSLVALIDFVANRWSATINGATAFANVPLSSTGNELSLGQINARWVIGAPGTPGDNYMVFDNYRIAVAAPAAPVIATQPIAQTAVVGAPATLSVAATGVPPPTYQWRKDGTNVAGATNSSYSIANVQLSDAGSYDVVATNFAGSATSSAAAVNVITQWPNNDFAGATALNGTPVAVETGNLGATKETGEPNHAGNAGGHSVWWTWTAPATGTAVLTTIGSGFDTLLAVYTGTVVNALTLVASDDNSGANQTSQLSFPTTAGTTYKIVVDGAGGATGSIVLNLAHYAYVWTTLAGSVGNGGSADGTGSAAQFRNPYALAVDNAGRTYVADSNNHTIRVISPSGIVTTLAGLAGASGSADGAGSAARFNVPIGLALDAVGNIFVVDCLNSTIRKVTPAGVVTTLAGQAGATGIADGVGAAARFNQPTADIVDSAGNVYVCDQSNHTIRKITSAGVVTTLAGSAGNVGSADGVGTAARFNYPTGIAIDPAGNVYVSDNANYTLRKITPPGVVSTLAGHLGLGGASIDGVGSVALFDNSFGLAMAGAGNILVVDVSSHDLRLVTPNGLVTTIAGLSGVGGNADGPRDVARFNLPTCVAADGAGNLYVSDRANQTIRLGIAYGPPRIITQPQPQAVVFGGDVNLTVAAIGAPTPAYQWRKGGTAIIGATGTTLALNAVQVTDAGTYDVVVSNSAGSVTSSAVALSVTKASQVITFSTPVNRTYGDAPFGISASASSGLPITFTVVSGNATTSGSTVSLSGAGSVTLRASQAGNENFNAAVDVDRAFSVTKAVLTVSADNKTRIYGAANPVFSAGYAGFVNGDAIGSVSSLATMVSAASATSGVGSYPIVASGAVAANYSFNYINGALAVTKATLTAKPDDQTRPEGAANPVLTIGYSVFANNETTAVIDIPPIAATTATSSSAAGAYPITLTGGNDDNYTFVFQPGTLTITPTPPSIVTAPQSQQIVIGTNLTLVVTATGTAPLTYQWSKNGTAVPTATNASLVINNAALADAGDYTVTVANAQGSSVSSIASISVIAQWSNNDFANAALLSGTHEAITAGNVGATKEAGEPSHAGNAGGHSVWWNWTAPVTGTVILDTAGSSFDTLLAVYTGTAVNALTAVAADDNSGGNLASRVTIRVTAGVTYRIVVDGANGTTGGIALRLSTYAYSFSTLAGMVGAPGSADGMGSAARFNTPFGVVPDSNGNLFVADSGNDTIRRISAAGNVTTLAGLAGVSGSADGAGTAARFFSARGIALDSSGNVIVGDNDNFTIRRITAGGNVTTLAGSPGAIGSADGVGSAARFNLPFGLAVDANDNIFVADTNNQTIRKITAGGVVTTLAGSAGSVGTADGTGSAARFNGPIGVAVDKNGNVFVAVYTSHTIRKISPGGVVTTIAGVAGSNGSADGTGGAARFQNPYGVAVDGNGNLFVGDSNNFTIRMISPDGVVTTVAGTAGASGSADGIGSAARFNDPYNLAVDGAGNLFVSDTNNHTVRVGFALRSPSITLQPQAQTVAAGTNIALTVSASGYPAPTYQWRKGGIAVIGATTATLTLSNVQAANAGEYDVVVANSLGMVTSNAATLTVSIAAPAITSPPANVSVAAGQNAMFTVVVTGTPAPSYQWQRQAVGTNGFIDLANNGTYAGANSPTLTVTGVGLAMSGDQFRCVAGNGVGAPAQSSAATLTINVAPLITSINAATFIVGQANTFTVQTTGSPAPMVTITSGALPAWASLDSVMGIISGTPPNATGSPFTFTLTAANGASPNATQMFTLSVQVASVPPVFTTQPQAQTVAAGASAAFAVAATGSPAPTLQWQRQLAGTTGFVNLSNDGNFTGSTTATLSLSATTATMSGDQFRCVATNSNGSATSNAVTLTVNAPPTITTQPASPTISSGQTATLSVGATGTAPLSYQWYQGASGTTTAPISGATTSSYTTPALTATASYWVRVTNNAGSANSNTATVTVATFAPTVALTAEASSEYITTGGTTTLRFRVTYTNQTPSAIGVTVPLPAGWAFVSYSGASAAAAPTAGDTLLEWAFSTFPTNEFTGTFVVSYVAGQTGNQIITGSVNYRPGNVSVPFAPLVLTPITPPAITTQPGSKLVAVETGTTLSVAANGAGTLMYQWKKDGTALVDATRITGTTTPTLSLANLALTDTGNYTVVVTNAAGATTSNVATITVVDARPTQSVMGAGYFAGNTVTLTQTLTYSGTCTGLGWQMMLPAGWTYAAGGGTEGDVKPSVGTANLLEWAWTTVPASPLTFTVTLNVPASDTGDKTITGLTVFRIAAGPVNVLVKPDPLTVHQVTTHSADTDRNFRLSLLELTRVIELYNTRNGSSRTGCYKVDGSGEDGFNPEPTRAGSSVVTLTQYHSGDSNHDGKLSLLELTRVIELYNYRAGSSRTGQYHVDPAGEDGFNPGP